MNEQVVVSPHFFIPHMVPHPAPHIVPHEASPTHSAPHEEGHPVYVPRVIFVARSNEAAVHEDDCRIMDASFHSALATVAQKQDYAECVRALYPESHSGALPFVTLAVLVYALMIRRLATPAGAS